MVYVFLPFLSAALYGLGYVLLEKLLKAIPIPTLMLTSSFCMLVTIGTLALFKPGIASLEFLSDKKIALLFFLTVLVNVLGWLTTLLALQNTSASYVSFVEISYPLFTLLFLFLIFREYQFNWISLIGGTLILSGSAIIVMAQLYSGKS